MLYYTDSPFAQPHFFRRGRAGWQLDLIAEILNTRNTIGGGYSWTLWNSGDDFFRAFRDRWVDYNGGYRPAGGDNRQLPTSGADAATMVQEPLPIARSDTFMEHLTVLEAADRIRAQQGAPTLVVLYETWSDEGRAMLPGLARLADSAKTAGLPFLAFSMDQEEELLRGLPPRLRQLGSPFPAVHLYHWWPGMLAGAWTSAGIPLDIQFDIPVVALVSSDGEFLGGTQGRVPPLSQLLERLPGGH